MILLDTSVLVEAVEGGNSPVLRQIRIFAALGERVAIPTLVLYEFLRGPRRPEEIALQRALFPNESALLYGHEEAEISAKLYRAVRRGRGREFDLAIASCAIACGAALWTLNLRDFSDIPELRLAEV